MQHPRLGNHISGSLYDKIELAVDVVVGAFNGRLCKALEGCDGRLDRFVGVMAEFEKVAKFGAMTELSALATVDSKLSAIRSVIDSLWNSIRQTGQLWGMELAHCVYFVQTMTKKSDSRMFSEMFGEAGQDNGASRLVAVYNGGGTVNRDSRDAKAVIGWLATEFSCLNARYRRPESDGE